MLNFASETILAHGTNIHYYRTGGEKPPLVLVHGITDDGLCWLPVAETLAGQYDVIMVDMRGHGLSEAPESGYTLGNLAAELAELIKGLGLEQPILLGHSMGATAILVLAGLYPDLPKAILLEDPPAFWRFDRNNAQFSESRNDLEAWLASNKRKTHADLLAEVHANYPDWSESELEPWINAKHRFSPSISALVHPQDIETLNFPELLKHIICPAIFISADKELGAASSAEDIASLRESLPQLRVAHVAGAGHNIRRDQFESYIEIVEQVLVAFQGHSIC